MEELLERIDDRFRLLAGEEARDTPRYQRTLRGIVGWSHHLCTARERLLWARLSVFSGDFDLAAAEEVCSGNGIDRADIVRALSGLVHKSILAVVHRGKRTRYRMLETIRQYGLERLRGLGDEERLRERHREHYGRLTALAAADWCGPDEVEWLSRLRQDLPNIRAALDFTATRRDGVAAGLEITANLTRTRFWHFSSTLGEGRQWFDHLLSPGARIPEPVRLGAAALRAWTCLVQGDRESAGALLAECYDLARRVPGGRDAPAVLFLRGAETFLVRASPAAAGQLDRARGAFAAAGMTGDAHMAAMLRAMACAFLGDRTEATDAAAGLLAEARSAGSPWACSWALWVLGLTELRHGDTREAAVLFRDVLRRQWELGDCWGPVWSVEALAWAAAAGEKHAWAARLLGAAHQLRRATGVELAGLRPFLDLHDHAVRSARQELGAAAFAAAFADGAADGTVSAHVRSLLLDAGPEPPARASPCLRAVERVEEP
ncbi:hypothetical protein LE181_07050 [Streptomyces sp. SCA3-4]|uniref:ATP-binding protein n=1 Tax=Streptomyces sichuanensis TaxID=2871810 RepID=UPI001CE325DC|nr:hypothetical protein [Streptomyces sichuanensis]MCA6091920.1 hypothetical protein [Streptomyces sichuanensis]